MATIIFIILLSTVNVNQGREEDKSLKRLRLEKWL